MLIFLTSVARFTFTRWPVGFLVTVAMTDCLSMIRKFSSMSMPLFSEYHLILDGAIPFIDFITNGNV